MKFWQKANQWWLWATLFAIPLSARKVLIPVFYQNAFVDYASTSLFLSDLLIIGLLLLWLIDFKRIGRFNWGPKWLTLPLLLLAGWMWVSLLWAQPNLLIGAQSALRFLLYVGLYFYLLNRVKNIVTIVYPLAAGVIGQSLLAMGQYFNNHSLGLTWLGESVLEPAKSGIPVVLIDGARQLRAHGTLPHANVLGGYLTVSLAIMWPLLFGTGKKISQVAWWLIAGVGLIGLILSLSRSAWVMLIVGGVAVCAWLVWKHCARFWSGLKSGWPVILAVIVIILTQWQAIVPRWSSDPDLVEQISVNSRIVQWEEFKKIYGLHTITGVGVGQYFLNVWQPEATANWQYRSDLGGWSYSSAKSLNYYQPVHDVYLLALAELGPIGLGLLLWIIGAAVYLTIRLWWRASVWGLAGLWGVATIAGIGLTDHYWWTLPGGRLMFMLVLSLIAVLWVNPSYNGKHGGTKSASIS
ncbi:O-antigen ligase family protein [Patescibacteria group bacterium]|nr:O-antigen ligase family protein [Patescibacteria group bacterium]